MLYNCFVFTGLQTYVTMMVHPAHPAITDRLDSKVWYNSCKTQLYRGTTHKSHTCGPIPSTKQDLVNAGSMLDTDTETTVDCRHAGGLSNGKICHF